MAGDSNWSNVVTLIHFDGANASTTFHDSSLSAHTIAQSFGGQIGTAQAAFGTASADFVTNHGSGPCIRVANSPSADYQFGSGQFTIECWVYPTAANADNFIMHTGVGGSGVGAWGLYYNSSASSLVFIYSTDGSSNTDISGTCTLALNTWTHIAADYDGSTLRLYAGGSVVTTDTLSDALYATTQELAIGNDNHTDSGPWNGYIDEVRVTKGIARYAGAFTAPSAAFPAYGPSPQPELGGAGSGNATNASITYNVTTWEPNDILVVGVFNENNGTGNPATVASITSSGLTFAQRSIVSATDGGGMEVWWAVAATPLIAQSLTITFTGTFDDASSVAYGVAGCFTGAPWDGNGSLPATASGFSITGFSTTSSDDCLVTFVGSASGEVNPFGFDDIVTTSDVAGSWGSSVTTGYQDVSSTQSSISLAAGTGTFAAFIADALTADITEIDDSPVITGVAGTGSVGTTTASESASITGSAGTGSSGSVTTVSYVPTTYVISASRAGGQSVVVSPQRTNTYMVAGIGAMFEYSPNGYGSATGVATTGSAGTITTTILPLPLGAAATGQAGTAQTSFDVSITPNGVEADGQAGSLQDAFDATAALTGVEASGQTGTPQTESDANLTGVEANGQAGTPQIASGTSATVSGVETDAQVGTFQIVSGNVLTLTAVFGTTQVDTLVIEIDTPGLGIAGIGQADIPASEFDAIASLPGVEASSTADVATSAIAVILPAVAGTGQIDTLLLQIDSNVAMAGAAGTGQADVPVPQYDAFTSMTGVEGDSVADVTIPNVGGTPIGVAGTGQIDTLLLQFDSNIPMNGAAGTGQIDTLIPQFDESSAITGVLATGLPFDVLVETDVALVGLPSSGLHGTLIPQFDETVSLSAVAGTTQVGTIIPNDATASPVAWNRYDLGPTASLSSDHFTFTVITSGGVALKAGVRSTRGHSTGKWYFEVAWTGPGLTAFIGIANQGWPVSATTDLGWDNNSLALYVSDAIVLNGAFLLPTGIGENAGTVYGCAVDLDAQLIWFTATRMRTIAGFNWNNSATANPATAVAGVSFSSINAGPYFIAGEITGVGLIPANLVINAGGNGSGFVYPIPAGFLPWDNTGIGVSAIGAAGSPTIRTDVSGVAGVGIAGQGVAGPVIPISGVSATGTASLINAGFVASGATIIGNSGPFIFKSVNFWQGYENPGTFAGLPFLSWQNNLSAIHDLGFNCIRLSTFMAGVFSPTANWPLCSSGAGNVFTNGLNADLTGLNTLQFYDLVLDYCATIGLYVVVDMHSTLGGIESGFTTSGQFTLTASPSSWSADGYTDLDFITAWTTLATRWAGKPAFAACDLMNEPWGPGSTYTQWGPGAGVDLNDLFARTGNAIHAAIQTANPGYPLPLIVCQTHDSDFSNVTTYPLTLANVNKAVYAPHVYPSPLANGYPASGGVDNGPGAMAGWNAAWGFLVTSNTAPVYITEFGGTLDTRFPNQAAFWATITAYILGISGYSGAPTQQLINWSVANWDQVEGSIIGEDATGILLALSYPHPRTRFYPTVIPYLPQLLGSSLLTVPGVSASGGVGSLFMPFSPSTVVGVSGSSGVSTLGLFEVDGLTVLDGVSGSSGVPTRLAFGVVSAEIDVAITGVSGSSGVPTRLSFGVVGAEVDATIGGVSGSGAAGNISIAEVDQLAVISGVSASGSVGLLGLIIPDVSGVGEVGNFAIQVMTPAVGFGQAGTIQYQLTNTATVTGVTVLGLAGSLAPLLFVMGAAASAQVGLNTLSIQVSPIGVAGIGRAFQAGLSVRSRQAVMMIAQ